MRESGIIYRSFYEALKELPDEARLEVQDAIFTFMFDGVEVELKGVSKAMWTLIKPQIEANNRKYANGSKGGRPTKNQSVEETKKTKPKPNQNQTETNIKPNENDNVNDNVNVNDKENDKGLSPSPPPKKNELVKKNKPVKTSFKDSPVYDKNIFSKELKEYAEGKYSNYNANEVWQMLEDASRSKGYMYVDWIATAANWLRRDQKNKSGTSGTLDLDEYRKATSVRRNITWDK